MLQTRPNNGRRQMDDPNECWSRLHQEKGTEEDEGLEGYRKSITQWQKQDWKNSGYINKNGGGETEDATGVY